MAVREAMQVLAVRFAASCYFRPWDVPKAHIAHRHLELLETKRCSVLDDSDNGASRVLPTAAPPEPARPPTTLWKAMLVTAVPYMWSLTTTGRVLRRSNSATLPSAVPAATCRPPSSKRSAVSAAPGCSATKQNARSGQTHETL